MQQFTIPQFIDVEDKIFGPITTRQFLIMMGSVLFGAILYKIFYFTTFIILCLIQLFICSIFAFIKINGMPFHYLVLNILQSSKNPSLRVWNNSYGKDIVNITEVVDSKNPEDSVANERIHTSSRLNELSLIVDTQGVYHGEKDSATKIESLNKDGKTPEELKI